MVSTKEKIDRALGISCGKSMDEMLNELDIDAAGVTKTLNGLDEYASDAFRQIDKKALEIQNGVGSGVLAISDMTASLREVEDLIRDSKQVFAHIAENITGSDLVDAELVSSYSHLLESIHLNIAEFISIYKQKVKFVEKIKLMIFQQEQKKELMELKHKQDLEILDKKTKDGAGPVIDGGSGEYEFDTDKIIKNLAKRGALEIKFEDRIDNDVEDDNDDGDDENNPKNKK